MEQFIISLTSYPARINIIHKTIESLLNQTFKVDKIILWLAESQFLNKEKDLPNNLLNLTQNTNFEINWCEDIRSYKKLIPTLKMYPNDVIITCDDDVIYEKDCIEKLYKAYKEQNNVVWCHRGHYITTTKNQINTYSKWIKCINYNKPCYNILQTGVGAVLYPPNCFYKDILDKNLFLNLAYDTDDLWFWAMTVLNDYKIGVIKNNIPYINEIIPNNSNTLWSKNKVENDIKIKQILNKYPIIKQKITTKLPLYFYIKRIFNFQKNENHKIITILGFKIKLRNIK